MLYELRVYTAVVGRMADLVKRFDAYTVPLFAKHGITQIGYWTTVIGDSSEFTYMLAWDSLADRETRWGAFQRDPDWAAAREATEHNGPITARVRNSILQPAAFSPLR